MWQRLGLTTIDENLLYQVLSIPTYSGKEVRMQEFLFKYATEHGLQAHIDNKGNIYLQKGSLEKGRFFPCLVAHMDCVHQRQVSYIDANEPIPLMTEEVNGKHVIMAEGFGLGGDDKAGIVIALAIMERIAACKAVFFVEEEIGCQGSQAVELSWFRDVGYIIEFDSPEGNCASWSCGGERLFDRAFYEVFLEDLGKKFGLTRFVSHPYTDVMVLRADTSLACMNFGAGYYNYHSWYEYVIAEEMDNAAAMGIYLIDRLGNNEYMLPFTPHYLSPDDEDYKYFKNKFK